jgi:uncharacterized protein
MKTMLFIFPLAAVALAALALLWFHHALIYRFDQTVGTIEGAGIAGLKIGEFTAEDGHLVGAWLVAPVNDKPVILYFPGNFASTEPAVRRMKPFTDLGFGLAVLEYRGSGGIGGRPSETTLNADARSMYDQLDLLLGQQVAADKRFLHGFSLGTGLAVDLANQRDVAAVVLESPFASLTDYFTRKYRGLPMNWLMWSDRYDSFRKIGAIRVPLLLLRGALDAAIPEQSFASLVQAAGGDALVKTYPEGGHSNLAQHGATQDILHFYEGFTDAP